MRWSLALGCMIATAAAPFPARLAEIRVPAGRYYVGHVFGPQDYRAHANVEVGAFSIMRTEVTYELYREVAAWGARHGYGLDDPCRDCDTEPSDGKHPVTGISWLGVVLWANALSEKLGFEPAYRDEDGTILRDMTRRLQIEAAVVKPGSLGFRLPTLEEWQIAARGADKGLANGSYGQPHSGGWRPPVTSAKAQEPRSAVVGRLRPNALGLYDMSGNAAEWTATPFDMGEGLNGHHRYFFDCGESFAHGQDETLASCDFHSAGFADGDIGFRLVRSLPMPARRDRPAGR